MILETDVPIAQARMMRVLQMIIMLTKQKWAVHQIAYKLDTDTRTIYRYIVLLRELGFEITKEPPSLGKRSTFQIITWPEELIGIKNKVNV